MIRRKASSKSSLQALLESGKAVPRQPESVRARVMARVNASAMAAAPVTAKAPLDSPRLGRFPRQGLTRLAAATLAVGVAGAVYALNARWQGPTVDERAQAPTARSAPSLMPHVSGMAPAPSSSAATLAPPAPSAVANAEPARSPDAKPSATRPRPSAERQATYDAELDLMRSAHTAYAARDYASALVLAGEHSRRFPNGVLAEQREALRISSLMSSGRVSEARRAAAVFAKRFPRSVLLRKIQAETGTAQE